MALVALLLALGVTGILPSGAVGAPTTITEFPVEAGHPSNLDGLVVGSEGSLWFGDYWWPEGIYHEMVGRMDEGSVEEFDEGLDKYSSPSEFVAGPGGDVWFAERGTAFGGAAIGRVASNGDITRYSAGLGDSEPRTIMVGPDGNLWFTGLGEFPAVGFSTPDGVIKTFELPGPAWDAVGGPDGNVWFTYGGEGVEPAIGRIELREDGSSLTTLFRSGLSENSLPIQIIAASNGYLWFSDHSETKPAIGRVSSSGHIQEFSVGLQPESSLWDLAAGSAGNVWFTDRGARNVGRITPQGEISEFGNHGLADPRYITPGPEGNMWFTDGGEIGKVSPLGLITQLRNGIREDLGLGEIVGDRNGRLWFIANSGTGYAALGRVIPGDDSFAAQDVPSPVPSNPPVMYGRAVLKRARLTVSRHGRVILPLQCQSSTQCSGNLQLTAFRAHWKARRDVGGSFFSISPWASQGVWVQLSRTGRKLLLDGGDGNLTVRLQINGGSTQPLNQRLRLRLVGRRN